MGVMSIETDIQSKCAGNFDEVTRHVARRRYPFRLSTSWRKSPRKPRAVAPSGMG